ncbi:MAG: YDG domain-containing protein [Caldimonas sp.]
MNKHLHRLVFSRSLGACIAVAETVASAGKSASGERRPGAMKASIGIALAAASLALQAQGLPGSGSALTGVAPRPSLAAAATASTLPTGATVVKGSGTISVDGAAMTVNQTSQRLVTDWQSFSIGAGNSVRFNQPSSSSVALNRVTGDDASSIFGSLTANGHVYLQNANGVYFAPGAQVSVGSLVATSLNIDVGQFMLGNLRLSGGSEASGEVSNAGSISAAPGGHVVLAAPVVSNSGSITTPGGTTALLAGNAVNIDPTGSGLLSISVPVAAVNARLTQSGTITADGGAVQLAAAATDAALRTVMQVDGVVRARSIEQRDGQIVLSGGSSGVVIVGGQLDASGPHGGTIKVLGDRVGLTGQARLDASGASGGGTILVGGNRHGEGAEQNATNTYVGGGVVLDASATNQGEGGNVVVWADNSTRYFGQIVARGGPRGGNGGQAEVSGKNTLDFEGGSDLRAPRGTTGRLLVDPTSIDIGATADANGDGTQGDDVTLAGLTAGQFPGQASRIKATTVASLLATNDLSLAAVRGITVSAPVTVASGGVATTLSLDAQDITFNAAVTLNNASLAATASNSITNSASVSSLNSISLTAPTIAILAPLSATTMSLLTNSNSAFTSVTQDSGGAGVVNATSLTIGAAPTFNLTDSVDLSFSNNKIGTLVVNAGDVSLRVANNPGVPLVLSGSGPFQFDVVAVNTSVTQPAGPTGALTIGAGEGIFNVTTTGSGDVTLTNPANQFTAGLTFTAAGNVDIAAAGNLNADGSATGNVTLASSGVFTMFNTISGQNIDISGAGFENFATTAFVVPAGGRYLIRSSDFTQDVFGTLGFGVAAGSINFIVYNGYTGVNPTVGNGLFTNQTGSITPPNADDPPISKVYDGTPNFNYTQNGAATAGVLNAVSPVPLALGAYTVNGSGLFANKNAGVNKGLTVGVSNDTQAVSPSQNGTVLYGLQFAGYTRAPGAYVAGTPGNAVSQITAKPITAIGIDGVDRVYDATTVVGLNTGAGSLVGAIAGDIVSLNFGAASGTIGNKNVGVNKPVTVGGLALSGTDAGNYTVTDASAATATITAKPITSIGFAGIDRVYNGTTVVGVNSGGATLSGVIAGDAVGINSIGVSGSVANKNVGVGKAVTVGGVALNGADAGNYTVSDASGAAVAITPLGITSTGVAGVDRTYDGTTVVGVNTAAATLNGTIAGDNISLVSSGATGSIANKNVGVAKPVTVGGLTLGGTDAGNYTLTDASAATATIAALGVQATGITAIDRADNGTTGVGLNTSGAGVAGILPGDTVGVDASGAVGSVATSGPGVAKPVSVSGIVLTGPDAIDYLVLPTPIGPFGGPLTVSILSVAQSRFDDIRFKEYLQAVSDAQEPFRRAMLEALLSGFGKENIRKQLQRGLVFETGLAPPAIDIIDSAKPPEPCKTPGPGLSCGP